MSDPRRKIALVFPTLKVGGVERVRLLLAEQFLDLGYNVDLVVQSQSGGLRDHVPAQAHVHELGTTGTFDTILSLIRYFRKERPDAVIGSIWMLTSIVLIASKLSGRHRVVVSDHNPLSVQFGDRGYLFRTGLRLSIATFYRLASARVAVSEDIADDLSRLGLLSRKSITVINNPVSPQQPSSSCIWNELSQRWLSHTGKRVLSVGTLKRQKNFSLLISAFEKLPKRLDACLLIAGDGPERPSLEAIIADRGLSDRVLLAGHVDDVTPLYEAADLFVLASDYEGFGNVLLEALRAGTPVVSTDCGGPKEILENGRYGSVVPRRDTKALTTAMLEVLALKPDPAALKHRVAAFSPERIAHQYLTLLFPDSASKRPKV